MGLSTRVSMQWGNNQPNEPTDTLVTTSPDNHYVDIRLVKGTSDISWAFAGVCIPENNKVTFTHEIDNTGQAINDSGEFEDLPNGDEKEIGSMPNPDTNAVEHYIEIWRPLDPMQRERVKSARIEGIPSYTLIKTKGVEIVGKLVRVGNWAQAVEKSTSAGGQFSYLRVFYHGNKAEVVASTGDIDQAILEEENIAKNRIINDWEVVEFQ